MARTPTASFLIPRNLCRAALESLNALVMGVVNDDPKAKVRVVMLIAAVALPYGAMAASISRPPGWQLFAVSRLVVCAVLLLWLRRQEALGPRAAVILMGVLPSVIQAQGATQTGLPIEARIAWTVLLPAVAALLWGPGVAATCAVLGLATLSAVSYFTESPTDATINAIGFAIASFPIIMLVNATAVRLRATVAQLRHTQAERDRLQREFDEAAERERAKIASELHDDTIQVMTAATMKLDLIQTRQAPDGKTHDLGDALQLMQEAISRARRLSFDLYPPALDDGLRPALLEAAGRIGRGTFAVAVDVTPDRFAAESERLTFRTAKELLENARKHSKAEVVELKVALNGSIVELVVADDGVGFDSERLASTNDGQFHFGLRAAEERVRRAGGTLTVESTVGSGTTTTMLLPVGTTERTEHWPRAAS